MKRITHTTAYFVLGFALVFGIFAVLPERVAAQSYNYQYQPTYQPYQYSHYQYQYQQPTYSNTEVTRQQLIAQINALLAQLQQRQQYQNQYPYQYPYTNPVSQYDVEVETGRTSSLDDGEAYLYGLVDLNNAPYATVWFEWGEDDDDLDERTNTGRIDRNDSFNFRAEIDDLDDDERYYYRAVAQDPSGRRAYGDIEDFRYDEGRRSNRRDDDDEPDVETLSARDIDENSAEIRGEVDMNDFRNGHVFFVYGEDEDDVEEVEDEDSFDDIDERGDDLQKESVDRDLDGRDSYEEDITGLDDDTEYFFRICVEYEDEDDDETLECGDVEEFETDRD